MNLPAAPEKAAKAEVEETAAVEAPEFEAVTEAEPARLSPPQSSVVFRLRTPLPGRVELATRIPAGISAALMTAAMQRKIQRQTPCTHQDIVSEAIAEWLKRNGFP